MDKEKIKKNYQVWKELIEERKAVNTQITELIKSISDETEVKKGSIRKAFAFMKKKEEDEDELDGIITFYEEIVG